VKCDHARQLANDLSWAGEAKPGSDVIIPDELEEHLWACAACRAELAELRELRLRLGELRRTRPPEHLIHRTMAALRSERRQRQRSVHRLRVYAARALAAGVAVAALAVGGAYLANHRSSASATVAPNVKPLVAEYADFRGAQPFGDRDGLPLVLSHVQEKGER
jgi:predicted anti-sigma-YlaC factor YlaD